MSGIPIDGDGRFAGYASVFNRLDSGGDIVLPGAFAKSLAKKRGRMGGGAGEIMTVAPGAGPALPLSPVHLEGLRAADGSITLEWTRRSRADGDGWGVAEPPLEFAPENWQVEIVTGGVTVRTLSTAQCSVPYPLADQIADLGAPASGFTFSVRQVSAALGAGHGATGEFHG
ncbi:MULTISPECIES: hypothetical protein [Devosia]|uniref:hypothetical protein n=1 Tax=Devosia TaxID=46913 RepID=UPI000CE9A38C|nr:MULTISPECIES: hypothetical protein [Devosia]AVF02490.1 hypothetical protein C4375_01280 [Devosia sp. I507]